MKSSWLYLVSVFGIVCFSVSGMNVKDNTEDNERTPSSMPLTQQTSNNNQIYENIEKHMTTIDFLLQCINAVEDVKQPGDTVDFEKIAKESQENDEDSVFFDKEKNRKLKPDEITEEKIAELAKIVEHSGNNQ